MTIERGKSNPKRASFRRLHLAATVLVCACSGNDLGPPPPVATVSVTPASAALLANETQQLTATTLSGRGTVLTGRAVTWSSSDLSVVTVTATGQITGVAGGTAVVSATSEGKSGSATIAVWGFGDVKVTTQTSGTDLDPDGYEIQIDSPWDYGDYQLPRPKIAANGTVNLRRLPATSHVLTLLGVAANCTGEKLTDRPITIAANSETKVVFQLDCK